MLPKKYPKSAKGCPNVESSQSKTALILSDLLSETYLKLCKERSSLKPL